jgi:hypothetical protein
MVGFWLLPGILLLKHKVELICHEPDIAPSMYLLRVSATIADYWKVSFISPADGSRKA